MATMTTTRRAPRAPRITIGRICKEDIRTSGNLSIRLSKDIKAILNVIVQCDRPSSLD
jgi:hypothetical protein